MENLDILLLRASVWVLPVLIAITLHEAAHGYVAWKLGDDTAYRLGRVTFNPFKHVDPFGTVILPALLLVVGPQFAGGPILFGWAKPVPVNFLRLRNPKRYMVWVAAAGPGVNIALAVAAALLEHALPLLPEWAQAWGFANLRNAVVLNLWLAVFNMIPLPPLDGGRVAVGLLPTEYARPLARLERYGLFIVIGLIFVVPLLGAQVGLDISVIRWVVWPIVDSLYDAVLTLTGHG